MGGWDKAPEYGGGGGKWATIISVIAAVLFSLAMAWIYFASAAAQTTPAASPEVAYVTANSLNVRAGPGPEHAVVARLAHGSRVEVLDARIRRMLIEESQRSYYGSCPCPYNVDRGGRRCGGRSAYSRPGGASPLCYEADVSDGAVAAFRARLGR